jgi:hypothetical protein
VRAPGWAAALTERRDFDPGAGWNDVAIELERGGAIEGRVVDRAGAPQPRALVAIHDFHGDARTVLADRDGNFRCASLRAVAHEVRLADRELDDEGSWIVGIAADGPPHGDCIVRAGETTRFDLVVDRIRVAGTLRARGFDPRGWRAELTRAHDTMPACTPAPVGADGAFTLVSSSTGAHVLTLRAPGGPIGNVLVRVPVELAAGDVAIDVPLALAPLRARADGAAGLASDAYPTLVQENGARRVTTAVCVDPTTLRFEAPLAPVGDVVLTAGTRTRRELGHFVVAPR